MFEELYQEHPAFGLDEMLALWQRMPELEAVNAQYNPALTSTRHDHD